MGIKFNYKLSQYGQELDAYEGQAQRALDTLTTVISRLETLKETIISDVEVTATDQEDALLEVDAAISSTIQNIKTYASTLP